MIGISQPINRQFYCRLVGKSHSRAISNDNFLESIRSKQQVPIYKHLLCVE
jgi:hypothetical protein